MQCKYKNPSKILLLNCLAQLETPNPKLKTTYFYSAMQNLLSSWLQRSYTALFFLLPWSVEVLPWGFGIQVPTEPLMLVCTLLLLGYLVGNQANKQAIVQHFWAVLLSPKNITARLWHHPLALSFLWLIWMGIAAIFSSMPLVSWKYWAVEATHWWVFAFGMALVPGLWRKVLPCLGLSMALFVGYALAHHSQYHFRDDQAMLSPMPFFPEHTLYAAVLALLLPWSTVMAHRFGANQAPLAGRKNWIAVYGPSSLLVPIYLIGLWFAGCRAAWLSVAAASGVLLCLFCFRTWGNFFETHSPHRTHKNLNLNNLCGLCVKKSLCGYIRSGISIPSKAMPDFNTCPTALLKSRRKERAASSASRMVTSCQKRWNSLAN